MTDINDLLKFIAHGFRLGMEKREANKVGFSRISFRDQINLPRLFSLGYQIKSKMDFG